jgi:hypothetical protein
MKHLIPYLQDAQRAADSLRQVRWPAGITCPRRGSEAVEPRERCDHGLQRFHCVPCAARLGQPCARFTDWTRALCEESQWRPRAWLWVMGLWPWQRNATAMAAAADIQARTAQRCIQGLDGGLYATYHLEPTRQREHPVEAQECSQSAGSTGLARAVAPREREPRQRGLPLRGRAPAEAGRPPLLGWVQRRDQTDQEAPAAPGYLAVREHVRPATIQPSMAAKVQGGAPCCTDAYTISHVPAVNDAHRTVNHGAGA